MNINFFSHGNFEILFGQLYIYFRCVRVVLHSSERVDATLIVSYVVNDASWTPLYDIRVFTKDKTLNVCVHAYISIMNKLL